MGKSKPATAITAPIAEALEKVATLAQKCYQENPVIILGSGASIPHGLPSMHELQKYLADQVNPEEGHEADAWEAVENALSSGLHLEQALSDRRLPHSLLKKIVTLTWQCISLKDKEIYYKTLSGNYVFPIGNLFRGLFQGNRLTIDVITPNYDRIVEYACGSVGLIHSTGFSPGYIQNREGTEPIRVCRGNRPARTVKIWKVHGSLDWFQRPDSTTFAGPLFEIPASDIDPLIVTPGIMKHETTHNEPFRSAIQGADGALEKAQSFLCIGYGFRDTHIEPKIVESCRQKNVPITVLARTLTEEARAFLSKKSGSAYLAFEKYDGGTRAYSKDFPTGIDLPGVDYWSVDGYLGLVS